MSEAGGVSDERYHAVICAGESYVNAARQVRTAPVDGLLICCTYVSAETAATLLRVLGWTCEAPQRGSEPCHTRSVESASETTGR